MSTTLNTSDFANVKCGYLERRSKWFKIWTVRWFVLNGRVLSGYSDKTLASLRGQFHLTPSTTVETLPHEGARQCVFIIKNAEIRRSWIFCADCPTSLESWMIHIIQAIKGPFKDSENFETGEKWVDHVPKPLKAKEIHSNVKEEFNQSSSSIESHRCDERQLQNKES
mmetsp:Transcript_4888/g.6746  ORF Transcript_4888/g.6746 Transcript_4888/m.6746 type:complete len:168 (+) Transcript_4888:59-562(+)